MIPDPPARADGRCALRGCGKRIVIPKSTYASAADYAGEPFCSSVCCRTYHGVISPSIAKLGKVAA